MSMIDPFTFPTQSRYAKSPVTVLMGDDRVIRMTANQFKSNFQAAISHALFVEKVLHDSANYNSDVLAATADTRYHAAFEHWISRAKAVHRFERRHIKQLVRQMWYLPSWMKLKRFVKKARRWQWVSRADVKATIDAMDHRELRFIYSRDDMAWELRPGLPPRHVDYLIGRSDYRRMLGNSGAEEAHAILREAKEVMDIAATHPTGTMVYLPVRLMHAIMNLETTVTKPFIESIRYLDLQLDQNEPADCLEKKRFLHRVEPQANLDLKPA